VIIYDPSKLLSQIAPKKKIKRLLSESISLKKTALSFVDDVDFISKRSVSSVALKTIKAYKKRIKDDPKAREEIKANPALLIQRVQNEVIWQIKEEIKDKYRGETYRWLPSDADEPDPEHQLNYGKVFQVGVGEMPGDRIGCRCGMEILTDDKELDL
jgi:gas vesicle protein